MDLLMLVALKSLGEIMHHINCLKVQEMDAWAKSKLERVANNLLVVETFWLYVKSEWLPKTRMWVVGYCNLLYVGQDKRVQIQ
jgi:hypothetical protein